MKKTILILLLAIPGCTTFRIESPDGTVVSGTSCITDFEGVYGEWPNGGWFELTGVKTQAEVITEAFKAGIAVGGGIAP